MSDTANPEPSAVSKEEIEQFFETLAGRKLAIPETLEIERDRVVVRMDCQPKHLRPGGFISGPTQMGLADHVAYLAVFTRAGITPMAMTSNLNMNFLRPCKGEQLDAEGKILKYGRASIVVEVTLRGNRNEKDASHAIVTYVLPKE